MSSKLPADATSVPEKEPITINESRQYTALAKKALSFQKRQKFTNVCCITLCPLIMVVISAGLGALIQTLIARSTVVYEYIYCSNIDNMDANNVPFWDTSDWRLKNISTAGIPGAKLSELYTTNWFIYLVLSTTRGPGAALALSKKPCTYWFGEQYPNSALYEKPTVAVGNLVKDSSYLPQPRIGWLQTLTNATTVALTINIFNQHQQRAWAVIGADVSVDLNAIGVKPQATPLSVVQFLTLPPQPLFTPPNATSNGLLNTIPTKYYVSLTSATNFTNISFIPVPFYNLVSTPAGQNDLDDIIASGIRNATEEIKRLDKTGLTGRNTTRYNQVFVEAAKLLSPLPHGSIYFQKIDHASKSYKYTLSFGEDDRLVSSSNFPPAGRRLLLHQTQLSNAILRTGNVSSLSTAQITQGLRLMPQLTNTELKLSFGGVIGGILYPFGVSFLLPIFAIMLVSEKEKRILVMMKMNGMKNFPYYVSHYVTFFVMYVVSSFIFLVSGAIGKLTMFTLTGPGLLVWMFFLWGHNQIALAFFFANFFNKSRFALSIL